MTSMRKNILNSIFYIMLFLLVSFLLSHKVDYHVDEISTYILSNADHWFTPQTEVTFTPASQPFVDIMSASGSFDLHHVWEQQSNDTHPPVYYALVHGICSLFPGSVSVYYAGVINIIFILLTLFYYRKIAMLLTESPLVTTILSMVFIFSAGLLSITSFLRMYVMTIFWITLFAYLLMQKLPALKWRDYLILGIVASLGALTHYYFIVYVFFASACFVLYLIFHKRGREVLLYILTMCVSGGLSCLIYPAMIRQIFLTGRGAESLENMSSTNLVEQVKIYYTILNDNMFGGLLGFLLLACLLCFIIAITIEKRTNKDNTYSSSTRTASPYLLIRFIILLVPAFCYLIIIAKSAVYNSDRYISPIFAVTLVGVLALLYHGLARLAELPLFAKHFPTQSLLVLVSITILWLSFQKCPWKYMYLDSKDRLSYSAVQGADSDAIILYNTGWKIDPHYLEISNCKSSTFYQVDSFASFEDKVDLTSFGDNIALFVIEIDASAFLQEFIAAHPEYTLLHDNGHWGYGTSYYLSK